MPHITLSIPQDVYDLMKKHPEVKWTQVVREGIRSYALDLEGETTTEEIRKRMDPQVLAAIKDATPEQSRAWLKAMREKEWKKRESWTRART